VIEAARSATSRASTRSSSTVVHAPPASFTRETSESLRKRLHVRSMSSSSEPTARTAASRSSGSATTTAVVPRAGNDVETKPDITNRRT
jgi:hypothetical protein